MKHLSISMAVVLFFSLSLTAMAQSNKGKSKGAMQASMQEAGTMPYTAMYSSKFQMGDSKYSRMVLDAWKAYDENSLDNIAGFIADTVTAVLPDGTVLKGRENFLTTLKAYRGGFSTVKDEVEAWFPVKSLDKGDDVVCIWGTETDTKADGSTQKVNIHELWVFNKEGKVFYFRQYAAQVPKEGQ